MQSAPSVSMLPLLSHGLALTAFLEPPIIAALAALFLLPAPTLCQKSAIQVLCNRLDRREKEHFCYGEAFI